jgi:O-antigen ligase
MTRSPGPVFVDGLKALAIAAAAGPTLLAYNVAPSPTFLNQALAVAFWGWFVVGSLPGSGGSGRGVNALYVALALMLAAIGWSWGPGSLPTGLALSAIGLVAAAGVLAAAGAAAHARADAHAVFGDFCVGFAVAGVLNVVIALVQVFAPGWTDGDLIATSGLAGRAVGNLRQPNHLSSLLLWSAIAVVALAELGRLGRRAAAALFAAIVFAVVLTASRTGLVGVGLLALWALVDRRLARPTRMLLLGAPLLYALAWFGMAEWARWAQHVFGGAARLAEGDLSSSRFGIWRNSLAMIAQQPWGGVGFGEFNFAWTLTPFPGRPVAFFDHTHNLPLQLAVELGIPLASAVMLALLVSLGAAARLAVRAAGPVGLARRAALMMVLMIGLHSLLEYPLWYAYFLLPAAWALAFAGGEASLPRVERTSRVLVSGGLALFAAASLSVADYLPVTTIFSASSSAGPLEQRIARGQRSLLFSHHADYAAATTDIGGGSLQPFERATHYLLDTRLMMAWAKALAAAGDVDNARWVAARLREFRNPASDEFFEPCKAAAASAPFQCEAPQRRPDWRDFLR